MTDVSQTQTYEEDISSLMEGVATFLCTGTVLTLIVVTRCSHRVEFTNIHNALDLSQWPQFISVLFGSDAKAKHTAQ